MRLELVLQKVELEHYQFQTVIQILSTQGNDKNLTHYRPTLDRISSDIFYHQITDLEPNAFEGKTSSLPDLRRYFLPLANINEFLIEKSPQYARGHIHEISNRAKSMYEANPNMKLFAFVTDPVERLFSHINHCIKKKWPFCQTRFQTSASDSQRHIRYVT